MITGWEIGILVFVAVLFGISIPTILRTHTPNNAFYPNAVLIIQIVVGCLWIVINFVIGYVRDHRILFVMVTICRNFWFCAWTIRLERLLVAKTSMTDWGNALAAIFVGSQVVLIALSLEFENDRTWVVSTTTAVSFVFLIAMSVLCLLFSFHKRYQPSPFHQYQSLVFLQVLLFAFVCVLPCAMDSDDELYFRTEGAIGSVAVATLLLHLLVPDKVKSKAYCLGVCGKPEQVALFKSVCPPSFSDCVSNPVIRLHFTEFCMFDLEDARAKALACCLQDTTNNIDFLERRARYGKLCCIDSRIVSIINNTRQTYLTPNNYKNKFIGMHTDAIVPSDPMTMLSFHDARYPREFLHARTLFSHASIIQDLSEGDEDEFDHTGFVGLSSPSTTSPDAEELNKPYHTSLAPSFETNALGPVQDTASHAQVFRQLCALFAMCDYTLQNSIACLNQLQGYALEELKRYCFAEYLQTFTEQPAPMSTTTDPPPFVLQTPSMNITTETASSTFETPLVHSETKAADDELP